MPSAPHVPRQSCKACSAGLENGCLTENALVVTNWSGNLLQWLQSPPRPVKTEVKLNPVSATLPSRAFDMGDYHYTRDARGGLTRCREDA